MTTQQQPEALRLADQIESKFCTDEDAAIAAELRRLHTESEQHLQELAAYRFTVENLRARVDELEAQLAAAPQAVPASVIAGAVFDFAGYLTTLPHKEAIHCSEAHEAAPMVEAITEWCKRRNLTTDGAKVETWRDHLAEAPAHPAEGVPAQAVELEVDDLIDRLLDAQQDLNLAANVHMDQSIASASTLLDKVEIALRTLSATHPTQQWLADDEQQQLDIGKAIERVCRELPEGAEIQIYLECGAGAVNMTDWDGNEFDHFSDDGGSFADQINAAVDGAIAAKQVAAQAKQGGE